MLGACDPPDAMFGVECDTSLARFLRNQLKSVVMDEDALTKVSKVDLDPRDVAYRGASLTSISLHRFLDGEDGRGAVMVMVEPES